MLEQASLDDLQYQDEFHVWIIVPELFQEDQMMEMYPSLLSLDERDRYSRYMFEKHRLQFLLSRVLLRTILSKYTQISAHHLTFTKNQFGRPFVSNELSLPVFFSLSHTDGLIACLISSSQEAGMDVENMDRRIEIMRIAERFFSQHHIEQLRHMDGFARRERFFQFWTLGEAYVKARGVGLALPFDQLVFSYCSSGKIQATFGPKIDDSSDSWQFMHRKIMRSHAMAIAIKKAYPVSIVFRWVNPRFQIIKCCKMNV